MGESKRRREGICKLTGLFGRYVKSHIIPEALTETLWKGQPLTQLGRDGRLIRRQTSWYDPHLVTQHGEDILAAIDNWAVNFFRERKLVWSSWDSMEELDVPDHVWIPDQQFGFRKLTNVDGDRLRLFFLSILWRAAATKLFEFERIAIPASELEQLGQMVRTGLVEPQNFYPTCLIQLSTRNFPHNRAAGRGSKNWPDINKTTEEIPVWRDAPFFRFYIDGLIAHMHIEETLKDVIEMGDQFVGLKDLSIITLPSEDSAEMKLFWHDRGGVKPPASLTRRSYLL